MDKKPSFFVNKIINRTKRKFWYQIVCLLYQTKFYPYIYRSYWHSLLAKKNSEKLNFSCYYSACPHPGAGIGHQIANWNAGYWYAKKFGLRFAHIPFATNDWEQLLGFGEGELYVNDLIKKATYKKRKLPLFNNESEMNLNKKIINSYKGQKVVFIAEQDQFYRDQIGVINDIKYKFHNAKSRKNDKLKYSNVNFNIAIHIRRGDIMTGSKINPEYENRYQDNSYFLNILNTIIKTANLITPLYIYVFSQGDENKFNDFKRFNNVQFCLNMSQYESFLHLVYADLLITSKSGFSYIPALLSNGIKICPVDFWHNYPTDDSWIMADINGTIEKEQVQKALLQKLT